MSVTQTQQENIKARKKKPTITAAAALESLLSALSSSAAAADPKIEQAMSAARKALAKEGGTAARSRLETLERQMQFLESTPGFYAGTSGGKRAYRIMGSDAWHPSLGCAIDKTIAEIAKAAAQEQS